jgi:glycosidase
MILPPMMPVPTPMPNPYYRRPYQPALPPMYLPAPPAFNPTGNHDRFQPSSQPAFAKPAQPLNQTMPGRAMPNRSIPIRTSFAYPLRMPAAMPVMAPAVNRPSNVRWHNDLKQMFHRNQAIIYALNIRTFGAQDKNGDARISVNLRENGTFLSAVNQLDQLVNLGVNTIHVLPINPIGQTKRLGEGGSLYAPSDYHSLNPEFDTPGNNLNVLQEARIFVDECHKRGIHVMVDVPSCASADLTKSRPDLILKDKYGRTLVPTNWIDIVMFKNDKALQDYYEGFFDLMANKVGVDGFRVDVARARTLPFWQHFIGKYPDKAWLAESYCQEDQSPLKNLPRDIPEDLLKVGFDSFYGQFHIFHSMSNAKEYMDYMLSNRAMFQRASQIGKPPAYSATPQPGIAPPPYTPFANGQTGKPPAYNPQLNPGETRLSPNELPLRPGDDKSFIGSFLSHDDPSLMEHGGVPMCLLSSGLMTTQPWTNPYILDGFTTGYTGDFDIFNFVPQHKGNHPEIGLFLKHMLALRKQYEPVLNQGAFIPIPVNGGPNNQVIAFARQANGKTLLVIANKDINARQKATLNIPGLLQNQPMQNLVPGYGRPSYFYPSDNQISVDMGPGRFHMFEINTPHLAQQLPTY